MREFHVEDRNLEVEARGSLMSALTVVPGNLCTACDSVQDDLRLPQMIIKA